MKRPERSGARHLHRHDVPFVRPPLRNEPAPVAGVLTIQLLAADGCLFVGHAVKLTVGLASTWMVDEWMGGRGPPRRPRAARGPAAPGRSVVRLAGPWAAPPASWSAPWSAPPAPGRPRGPPRRPARSVVRPAIRPAPRHKGVTAWG